MDEAGPLSIDLEEFTRLQTQLIELRTANYQLKEELSKKNADNEQLNSTLQSTTKELDKINKTLQKSKKAKEYQLLLEENESLQQQLYTQEEDFKLQNTTLMNELTKVHQENESLSSKQDRKESQDLIHLQAENTALQKYIKGLQEQRHTSDDSNEVESGIVDVHMTTLIEENKLLQQQLMEAEEKGRRDSKLLQNEIEKLSEKARRKQESVVQLQNEKESLLNESKSAYNDMLLEKEKEVQILQNELRLAKEAEQKRNEEVKSFDDLSRQLSILLTEKEELTLKCAHIVEDQAALIKERDDTKVLLEKSQQDLKQTREMLEERKAKYDDCEELVSQTQQANDDLADQLLTIQEDKLKLEEQLVVTQKLADKRKTLLDEMSIKEQEIVTENKKKEDEITEKYKIQLKSLQAELDNERTRVNELSTYMEELNDLRQNMKSVESVHEKYKEQIKIIEDIAEKEKIELQSLLKQQQIAHNEELAALQTKYESEHDQNLELVAKVKELELKLEENVQDVTISERKSSALIKDLKRQLQQFQKREEKLKEQLAQPNTSHSFSSPSKPADDASRNSEESSLSSLNEVTAISNPHDSLSSKQIGLEDNNEEGDTKNEIHVLLDKVATLQQEKWYLEEKVHHLESTGSALAKDVVQKSTIIQNYFMEHKADQNPPPQPIGQNKLSPMRLVQWAKAPGREETMAEINRKMQRALEEALMKNIHLQENVEMLSSKLQSFEKESN